ncbi:RHS repeat domain-containing protein, partial [Marinicrinis lubricantis]
YTYDMRGNLLSVVKQSNNILDPSVTDMVYGMNMWMNMEPVTVTDGVYEMPVIPEQWLLLQAQGETELWEQYEWDAAGRLRQMINHKGDISRYDYDGDGNRVRMTMDVAAGPKGNNGNGNGNNGNGNGNGNGPKNCHVVPPGFIPPGLAKKCGWEDESIPDYHKGGPRDGWE